MDFYVSWYPGDPVYSSYDPDCSMLISVSSVAARWRLKDLPALPARVILDSGGFRYVSISDNRPTPKALFEQQLRILEDVNVKITICALDYPIIQPNLSSNERDRLLHQTLAHAYEFRELADKYLTRPDVECMAIVQGYDIPTLLHCARELKTIGFSNLGLGSQAFLNSVSTLLSRIHAVRQVVGTDLHIFGVTAGRALQSLKLAGIKSIDSSTPAKAAMYNQVFYSKPFRRFVIAANHHYRDAKIPNRLHEPLPCTCPVCAGGEANVLLQTGKRHHVFVRTLHNYYHLKLAVTDDEI